MQYYRCKCGNCEAWGSMPPYRCSQCKECNSDLAMHPDYHQEPVPHDFSSVDTIEVDGGTATITRCRYCHNTQKQINKQEKV